MSGVISSEVTAAVPQAALSDPRRSTLACILGFSLAFLVACSFLTYKPVSHGLNLPFYPSTSSHTNFFAESVCADTAVKSYQLMQGHWK